MKKMNEESKRGYILIVIVLAIVISIIVSVILTVAKSASIIKEVEGVMASNEAKAIYIMRDDCQYCELNKSNMESMKNEYSFEYYNVNTNNLTKKDFNKLLEMLEINTQFGTPYLAVVKDGKMQDSLSGLKKYDVLFKFLKDNKLIAAESKLYLNYPTYSEYKKLIASGEKQVFVLAQSTCSYCLAEHPVLIEIAKETGAKINYLYLDYMFNSEEEYNGFMASLDWYKANSNFGTPTTLIVKNSTVRSYLSGYRAKDELIEFYRENGIIK